MADKHAENWRDTYVARATLLALENTGWTLCHARDFIKTSAPPENTTAILDEIETEMKRLDFLFGIKRT